MGSGKEQMLEKETYLLPLPLLSPAPIAALCSSQLEWDMHSPAAAPMLWPSGTVAVVGGCVSSKSQGSKCSEQLFRLLGFSGDSRNDGRREGLTVPAHPCWICPCPSETQKRVVTINAWGTVRCLDIIVMGPYHSVKCMA